MNEISYDKLQGDSSDRDIQIITVDGTHSRWSYEAPHWGKRFPIIIGDTYRHGGVSKLPFSSLNLALHVRDKADDVITNRRIVSDYLGVSSDCITCANQVHGLRVMRVTETLVGAGAYGEETAIPDCDAIYTNLVEVPLFLFTADCVGVAIYDSAHHALAVVHAGWKGTIGHLPVLTIEAMERDFGTHFKDCYIYLGPSIGPESFEVNRELADTFSAEWKRMTTVDAAELVQYIQREGSNMRTPHINLWRFIAEDLVQRGVLKENICIGGTDSMISEDCFSYRREAGKTGRMALFGMLTSLK